MSKLGLACASLIVAMASTHLTEAACIRNVNFQYQLPGGSSDVVTTSFGIFSLNRGSNKVHWLAANSPTWVEYATNALAFARGNSDGLLYIAFKGNVIKQYNATGVSNVYYGLTAKSIANNAGGGIYAIPSTSDQLFWRSNSGVWGDYFADTEARGDEVKLADGGFPFVKYYGQVAVRHGQGPAFSYIVGENGLPIMGVFYWQASLSSNRRPMIVYTTGGASKSILSWTMNGETYGTYKGVGGNLYTSPTPIVKVVEGNNVYGYYTTMLNGNEMLYQYICS
jgi:hypothetical protein